MGNLERKSYLRNSDGSVAATVAVSMVMLLSFAAVVVDVGNALVARNELQDVTDSAALAAARQLGVSYEGMTPAQQTSYVLSNPAPIQGAAVNMGAQNTVRGASVTINTSDVQIGTWNTTNRTLTVTNTQPNAVRVTARRQPGTNGPISTFLAGIMGVNSVSVTAVATAALTAISTTAPGELNVPFGISSQWFTSFGCNQPIRFYPTNSPIGCAGWHTFLDSPPNANTLRQIINGLIPNPPTYTTPGTQAGTTQLNFIGGNVANALNNLNNLYNAKKDANGVWHVFVPVYQSSDCSNPNSPMLIVGYATVDITRVLAPPAGQEIDGIVTCNLVEGGRGGGAPFGTLGSIPGLVQ